MGLIHDPEAEKRSIMLRRKALCNGQKTGRSCVHYWMHVEKVESNNPDNLRLGEIYRGCALNGASALHIHEMSESQLATICNKYEARRLPLWKRPLAVLGMVDDPGKFDGSVEDYKPLEPEEIRELQEGSSDPLETTTVGMGVPGATSAIADLTDEIHKNGKITTEEALARLAQEEESGEGIFEKGSTDA